jgi:hypothetical protein
MQIVATYKGVLPSPARAKKPYKSNFAVNSDTEVTDYVASFYLVDQSTTPRGTVKK